MAYIGINQIKDEILFFLRNQDILTTTQRGVSTAYGTSVLSGTAQLLVETTNVKNIRMVNVDGTTLSYGNDYTYNVNYDNSGTVATLISFNASQTGTATVQYDYGSTDRIFPDYPQPNLKLNHFPRIAFDILSGDSKENEIGGGSNFTDYLLSISCYDKNQRDVEDMVSSVRQKIMGNKKNFYYSYFITPSLTGPIIPSPFGQDKIMQRNQDFMIKWVFEE